MSIYPIVVLPNCSTIIPVINRFPKNSEDLHRVNNFLPDSVRPPVQNSHWSLLQEEGFYCTMAKLKIIGLMKFPILTSKPWVLAWPSLGAQYLLQHEVLLVVQRPQDGVLHLDGRDAERRVALPLLLLALLQPPDGRLAHHPQGVHPHLEN